MAQNKVNINTFQYVDLDISFAANPATGDVALKVGDFAVIQSVKNLIFTAFFERPFRPALGSGVEQQLFKPGTALKAVHLKTRIEEVLNNFEPRISLVDVVVTTNPVYKAFFATISFFIRNNTNPTTVTIPLMQRIR